LREQARQVIRGLVITGQMQPDQLYSVPRLAAELGVSATPVREALLDLEREGLLEAERNRGFRVVSLSLSELNDIFAGPAVAGGAERWRYRPERVVGQTARRASSAGGGDAANSGYRQSDCLP
jgi:DNA-binding FadR family transcriptional regulator